MSSLLNLIRIKHWIKNLLILLPAFFAGNLFDGNNINDLIAGFVSFSLAASGIYIINDLKDLDFDRIHPEKRKRAIAAGKVSPFRAKLIAIVCFISSMGIAYFLNEGFLYILITYIAINFLYSYLLKSIAVVDLIVIAIGFLLRIYAGGELAEVPISKWLFLLVFEVSIFIGLAKRRDDLLVLESTGKSVRKSISGYSIKFIDFGMVFLASITVLSYIMYTLSEEVTNRIGTDILHWSAVFVIIGILRYMQLTWVQQKSASPVKILLSDGVLIILVLAWLSFFAYCLYL